MRKSVAIVIPVWKEDYTKFEKISFQQCCSILKKHTFFLITYRGLNLKKYTDILEQNSVDFKVVFFNRNSFRSIESYSQLVLTVGFYSRFIRYKYILLYQIDCFVFRDELEYWVDTGYSYIGAPWLEGYHQAEYGDPVMGAGNGGLSLRNVGAHLRTLLSFSYIEKPKTFPGNRGSSRSLHFLNGWLSWLKNVTIKNNTFFLFNNYELNEDVFWVDIAANNFSWFTIPDWEVAALFSVEVQPKYFFELNNRKIPFGCHAWWTYDLDFWKPYIEEFGYNLTYQETSENDE